MLAINTSSPSLSEHLYPSHTVNVSSSAIFSLGHMTLTQCSSQHSMPVALRCDMPLDAIELDSHGYVNAFYESDNDVWEETFVELNKLGINTIAYFSDVLGPNFNVLKLEKYAEKFNVKLCHVALPFCPNGMAMWDESQWRIFDVRLSEAIGQVTSVRSRNKTFTGGPHDAIFH